MDMNYDLDLDLDNICRICLAQHERFVNIFSTHIVDGYIRTMPTIVQYCLDITVDEEDPLPKKICEMCKTTVINYFTFKERSKRTETVLLETFQRANKLLDTTVKNESKGDVVPIGKCITDKHKDFIQTSDLVSESHETDCETPDCNMTIAEETDESSFRSHLEEDAIVEDSSIAVENLSEVNEPEKTIEFVVDMPDHGVKEEYEFLDHTDESETQEGTEEDNLITARLDELFESSEANDYFCELCQKQFPKTMYVDHCRSTHAMCNFCLATYETEEELYEHEKTEHILDTLATTESTKKQKNSLLCHLCIKRWGTADQLRQHMRLHDALNVSMENKFVCHECRQCHTVYLKLEDLENHMSLHEGPKNLHADDAFCTDYQFLEEEKPAISYTCGFCKAAYDTMEDMRCHIIIHFDSFSCPFDSCGCEYETFSRLSLHIVRKHMYAEEHFCTHCLKARFATFDDLQSHIRNDCPAKKFPCDHCDKKFFSKKALKLHMKHADGKKHQCPHCSKSFAQHGELTLHLRTHTGEKPFKCTICFKTYRTASMRAAHMDAHIDGKTYQCTVCSKSLQSRTSYRNHMKRHTVGKSYKCTECIKSFYSKYHLDLHKLKIHNKQKEVKAH